MLDKDTVSGVSDLTRIQSSVSAFRPCLTTVFLIFDY